MELEDGPDQTTTHTHKQNTILLYTYIEYIDFIALTWSAGPGIDKFCCNATQSWPMHLYTIYYVMQYVLGMLQIDFQNTQREFASKTARSFTLHAIAIEYDAQLSTYLISNLPYIDQKQGLRSITMATATATYRSIPQMSSLTVLLTKN